MYTGERIDVGETLARLEAAARRAGFAVEELARVESFPLHAFRREGKKGTPQVYISAGVHGDEPAPPLGVLRLLESGLPEGAGYTVFPLVNPAGMARGSRDNAEGIDINRDYEEPRSTEARAHKTALTGQRFDLALCLHEDWESRGFYVYELNWTRGDGLIADLLRAAEPFCGTEPQGEIDGRAMDGAGFLSPKEIPKELPGWPEAIYLAQVHGELGYTPETPSNAFDLATRARCHEAVVRAAVEALCKRQA